MDRVADVGRGVTDTSIVSGKPSQRVAIIGGGYAGMAAAMSLAETGVRVCVYETAKILGGRARRIDYREEILDNGQHILSGAYSETIRLMALAGVPPNAVQRVPLRLDMPPHFSLRAPRLFAPLHLAWALLSAGGLTWTDRWAAIRFMRALQHANFRIDSTLTVDALLVQHQQPANVVRYLWQPLTVSALNTPIATASAQVFANVLRDSLASTRSASDLLLPQTDLTSLFPDAAARHLQRHGSETLCGVRVKRVAAINQSFEVVIDNGAAAFDAVILAMGPHQFDAISLPEHCAPSTPFSFEPIVTIYLKFDQRVRLPRPMLGQTDGYAQWYFDRRLLASDPAVRARHDGLIAAVISASGPHDSLSQEDLAARVLAELARFTGPLPPLAWHKVVTEKFATFACVPAVQSLRPPHATGTPGIFLAGDYTAGDYPATIEGAVCSGITAARHAADFLRAP